MNFLKNIIAKVSAFFASGAAKRALDTAANFTAVALPYIDVAAEIVTGLTPTTLDDKAYAAIKAKYPGVFDGSLKTGQEVKLYSLAVATELLTAKYPNLTTSIARSAVQLAYTGKTA